MVNEPLDGGVRGALGHALVHADNGSANNAVSLTFLVVSAKSTPLAELLAVGDTQEVGTVLSAQSLNDLDVVGVVARLGQDAKERLTRVEDAAHLAQSAVQRARVQSLLQRLLDGRVQVQTSGHNRLLDGIGRLFRRDLFVLQFFSHVSVFHLVKSSSLQVSKSETSPTMAKRREREKKKMPFLAPGNLFPDSQMA